jgi:hypothetical protein
MPTCKMTYFSTSYERLSYVWFPKSWTKFAGCEILVKYMKNLRVPTQVCFLNYSFTSTVTYIIQGDQKVSVHLQIAIQKSQLMFKVSPAGLQTFTDTPNCVLEDRVQYSTVHIQNVFCDGHLKTIDFCGDCSNTLRFCTLNIRCTETFWSPCICICLIMYIH